MKKTESRVFKLPRSVFLVGIKGVAMTSLSLYLSGKGVKVDGCDVPEVFPTDEILRQNKISFLETADFKNASDRAEAAEMIIYTGAHGGRDNPVVKNAEVRKIPVYPHGRALGLFMSGYRRLSVAGCHGKTTVTAITATILKTAGFDPSFTVGCGRICPIGNPGYAGNGEWFAAEADEYVTDPQHDPTPRFLWQLPEVAVITNIEHDHPDVYPSIKEVRQAYQQFCDSVAADGTVIISGDDPECAKLKINRKTITVGSGATCDFRISRISESAGHSEATVTWRQAAFPLTLKIPGRHNLVNAVFAAAAAVSAGVPAEKAASLATSYCGARRRAENLGKVRGVEFVDDYAHHPSEIKTTIAAIANWYGKKVVAVFQPHTFSRTKALLPQFAAAFSGCRMVILTDIYASARETDRQGLRSDALYEETRKNHPLAFHAAGPQEVARILKSQITDSDVVVFMGAGDIFTWQKKVMKQFGED